MVREINMRETAEFDKNSEKPLYFQCEEVIRRHITTEKLPSGSALPSFRKLSKQLEVSLITVKQAVENLAKDGIVYTIQGKGVFVGRRSTKLQGSTKFLEKRLNVSRKKTALIVPTIISTGNKSSNWFLYSEMVRGARDAASTYIVDLENAAIPPLPENSPLTDTLKDFDAYCFLTYEGHEGTFAVLGDEKPISAICFGIMEDNPQLSVVLDGKQGMYLMTRHVLSLGHKRTAYIGEVESKYFKYSEQRFSGYANALKSEGLEPIDELIATCRNLPEDACETVLDLLRDTRLPTAIICATDARAIGTIMALEKLGLKVPGDISVTGFDETPDANFTVPALTTIGFSYYQAGVELVRLLSEAAQGGNTERRMVSIQPEVVHRESLSAIGEARSTDGRYFPQAI